jgi:hypothetical protein
VAQGMYNRWRGELKGTKQVSDLDVIWTEFIGLHELASRVDAPGGPGHVEGAGKEPEHGWILPSHGR